ncbi:selenide, water dikinase SelD [Pseudotabrizicola sediminis]|uniref:Selenide, water dikinase SelD n=1 Tax=Pseudotabrizicola sediminis TaxID=2486418 RepID=A0ABY2KPS8_9RHOB|nr:selenide, water dikinase SelD [Pseudotabrizicola sediminis]TGD44681.1 selenide, water dikinase SelD [Pseudotabrizicola sediminis]
MQIPPLALTRDIVLIGGGHAHALVLRMWGMDPLAGARVTVVNPGPVAPYTGMLPGAIAGHYTRDAMMIDLVRLARFAGARVILDRACGIDRAAGQVVLTSGRRLRYDVASIDIGIASDLPDVPGYAEHGVAAKPLGAYAARWEAFVAAAGSDPQLTIIGAGVGGVELALASAHRLRGLGKVPRITLLDRGAEALTGVSAGTRATLLAALRDHGVALITGVSVAQVLADAVVLTDGRRLASDFTLSVAGARPQDWLTQTGLALTDGFVDVGPTLQSSDPAIFAVGDCAHLTHAPRPKAGVFAVREAPFLLHNLRAAVSGGAMRRYRPQRDYLKLVSVGGKTAVADKFGLRAGGGWLWGVKDRIDAKFMAKFAAYPAMARPALPKAHAFGMREAMGDKPMCGGCGAKVGAGALRVALGNVPAPARMDVLSGPGDDAALLRVGGQDQVITTDHLRAFSHDPALMGRLAAVHALGDVWAMGADPQAALAQITLPRLSDGLQADMLAEVMQAASAVFRSAGADVVGGHSSVGDELTVGFTVTGLLAGAARTKGGAREGDAIVLTKPLGSGVVLAAEMALVQADLDLTGGLMLGEIWAGGITSMARPLGPAAAILRGRAHAMTDVTGFGLAGHLWEMLEPEGLGATLSLADVPLLPGAEGLAAQGVASTLAPANRAAVGGQVEGGSGPRLDLLFDPQTCGGLLVCLPADAVDEVLAAMGRAGELAVVIGQVTAGPGRIVLR